mmetsp:Transcript_27816/g.75052  ORF Transcript_27816/g.75052 Transcript_27816/m.75052 type:complete len:217 (-) Transcript_27816:1540-2190(-)
MRRTLHGLTATRSTTPPAASSTSMEHRSPSNETAVPLQSLSSCASTSPKIVTGWCSREDGWSQWTVAAAVSRCVMSAVLPPPPFLFGEAKSCVGTLLCCPLQRLCILRLTATKTSTAAIPKTTATGSDMVAPLPRAAFPWSDAICADGAWVEGGSDALGASGVSTGHLDPVQPPGVTSSSRYSVGLLRVPRPLTSSARLGSTPLRVRLEMIVHAPG